MYKSNNYNWMGYEFETRKMKKGWIFVISGLFRTPFYSKVFPTKREATHSAIELFSSLYWRDKERDEE